MDRDIAYYAGLWHKKKQEKPYHTRELWNERADEWHRQLAGDSAKYRRDMARVCSMADYLRSRGLLAATDDVIDIGCGPGLFVAEFARSARSVTGTDLSDNMLLYAAETAKRERVSNVSFERLDFSSADIAALGWEKRFDLVFMSNTPAFSGVEAIERVGRMSRGFCCNSAFVYRRSSIFDEVMRELFPSEEPTTNGPGSFYALFNILWLMGYHPEVSYYTEYDEEPVSIDRGYADWVARFLPRKTYGNDAEAAAIYDYLLRRADGQPLPVRSETCYGRMLWDVRER